MERLWSAGPGQGDPPGRDPRLGWFAMGGRMDAALPSGRVLAVLENLALPSGPDDMPFAGATWDEAAGMLDCAAAVEAHVASLKLALVREIIRRHAPAVPAVPGAGSSDVPEARGCGFPDPATWDEGVQHEVAAVLRISWQSAEPVVMLAWELEARLPGVGALLDAGVLTWVTATIITREFSVLTGDLLARAEELLLDHDLGADGMTPGKIGRLCQRIVDTVDPKGSARRREQAERDEARVRFFRSHGGAAAMFASGLPADEALMSEANLQKRALEYKAAGIKEKMDLLRVLALVDSINGRSLDERVALYRAAQAARQDAADPANGYGPGGSTSGNEGPSSSSDGDGDGDGGKPSDGDGTGEGNGSGGNGSGGGREPGGKGPGSQGTGGGVGGNGGMPDPGLPSLINLTLPLADLLDPRAQRPGEAPGYGSLDPALVRRLAQAASKSARTEFCLTFTDENGHAVAHGCARLIRDKRNRNNRGNRQPGAGTGRPGTRTGTRTGQPRTGAGPPGTGTGWSSTGAGPPDSTRDAPNGPPAGWTFTRDTTTRGTTMRDATVRDAMTPGADGGYGTWILTVPGDALPGTSVPGSAVPGNASTMSGITVPGSSMPGSRYRVEMHAIPLHDCDHRYATDAYRPGTLLRHLVQIRDGECTFVGCSRPARESDFDHAIPYDKGGVTDACNAGMRSRRCHRVKQLPGWNLIQPEPGWHQWRTPSGRRYTQGPKRYPA